MKAKRIGVLVICSIFLVSCLSGGVVASVEAPNQTITAAILSGVGSSPASSTFVGGALSRITVIPSRNYIVANLWDYGSYDKYTGDSITFTILPYDASGNLVSARINTWINEAPWNHRQMGSISTNQDWQGLQFINGLGAPGRIITYGWVSNLTNQTTVHIEFYDANNREIQTTIPVKIIKHDEGIGLFRPTASNNWILDRGRDGTIDIRDGFGTRWDAPLMADFNKDGVCDRAVFRNGQWIFDLYNDGSVDFRNNFGITGDLPVVGDFNNDGVCDRAVFREGQWIINYNTGGGVDTRENFGLEGDLPIVGDFNNDRVCDRAVFRNGQWIIDLSWNGVVDARDNFGMSGDLPVVGDFNNDGACDRALLRNGKWIIDYSFDCTVNVRTNFGMAGDIPLVWRVS